METIYCPRCDRPYSGKIKAEVILRAKNHVSLQHPDHDPEWYDEGYPTTN